MKSAIATTGAPAAIGPYSQGIAAGGMVFVSGQLPIDAACGTMPADVSAQTTQSLKNIATILEAAGSSMDNVVKTTVFLTNMDLFPEMNTVYQTFFTNAPPSS